MFSWRCTLHRMTKTCPWIYRYSRGGQSSVAEDHCSLIRETAPPTTLSPLLLFCHYLDVRPSTLYCHRPHIDTVIITRLVESCHHGYVLFERFQKNRWSKLSLNSPYFYFHIYELLKTRFKNKNLQKLVNFYNNCRP